MSNENSKLNDLTKLLSDKDVVGNLSKNPNNAPEILKEANLTNEEAQDVGNLVESLKDLSPEELKLASGGKLSMAQIKEKAKKGFNATTGFVKDNWKTVVITAAGVGLLVDTAENKHVINAIGSGAGKVAEGAKGLWNKFKGKKEGTGSSGG